MSQVQAMGQVIAPGLDGSLPLPGLQYGLASSQVYSDNLSATFNGTPWPLRGYWSTFATPVAIGCSATEAVVVYRGTTSSMLDILTDLYFDDFLNLDHGNDDQLFSLDSTYFPGGGIVHPGFLVRVNQSRSSVLTVLTSMAPRLAQITFTGHSLGAALATYMAVLAPKAIPSCPKVQLVTYGAPACVPDDLAAVLYAANIAGNFYNVRYANVADPIATLPSKFKHPAGGTIGVPPQYSRIASVTSFGLNNHGIDSGYIPWLRFRAQQVQNAALQAEPAQAREVIELVPAQSDPAQAGRPLEGATPTPVSAFNDAVTVSIPNVTPPIDFSADPRSFATLTAFSVWSSGSVNGIQATYRVNGQTKQTPVRGGTSGTRRDYVMPPGVYLTQILGGLGNVAGTSGVAWLQFVDSAGTYYPGKTTYFGKKQTDSSIDITAPAGQKIGAFSGSADNKYVRTLSASNFGLAPLTLSALCGPTETQYFDDTSVVQPTRLLQAVRVEWVEGDRVVGIETDYLDYSTTPPLPYSGGRWSNGGNTWDQLKLDALDGEYLTSMSVWTAKTSHGSVSVVQVMLVTSFGNTAVFGPGGGSSAACEIVADQGGELAGVWGCFGNAIDSLGAVFRTLGPLGNVLMAQAVASAIPVAPAQPPTTPTT